LISEDSAISDNSGPPSDALSAARLLASYYQTAKATLATEIFDYIDGGSDDELARDEAAAAWQLYRFRPSVLRDVGRVADFDSTVTVPGAELAHPVLVAPIAAHGLVHPDAELATAAGAAQAAALLTVSTRATSPLESIASVAGPWWLQVYLMRDRALTEDVVRRAAAAGAGALVLTGDTPRVGRKARQGRLLPVAAASEQDPHATEADISWLAEISGLPVLVKGILRSDDAVRCLSAGASGLIVSNHGGRQLSRAMATAAARRARRGRRARQMRRAGWVAQGSR
jgi:4-hydroxymandelate oxidase